MSIKWYIILIRKGLTKVELKQAKIERVLWIYSRLIKNACVNKKELAAKFGVDERSIQRDISDINAYLSNYMGDSGCAEVKYKRKDKGYKLITEDKEYLTREDILAISRVLLESRGFKREDMESLIHGLLRCVSREESKDIKKFIGNELLRYTPVNHECNVIDRIWQYTEWINKCKEIEVEYRRTDGEVVNRVLHPISVIFSEYYFYLIAYHSNKGYDFPTVYRVDRILNAKETDSPQFTIPEPKKIEDGEFRKRVQFMYAGDLYKIKLEYTGKCPLNILDKLPTGKIVERNGDKYIIEAEVYGKGILMWLLSQGSNVKLLAPSELVENMKIEIFKMQNMYN